jgi:hypothetical protein
MGHLGTLQEMRSMKKPELYAEGGEVDHERSHGDEDEDLHHMMGEELMDAFDSKDKKRIMEGLEAVVLSCMNKRERS